MSFDSAISGDEFVQYKQGKAILDYYVNMGVTEQNKEVINDPATLLHLYGSSFDLFTAFFNDVFIEVLYVQSIALSKSFPMIYLYIFLNKNLNHFFDFFILGLSEAKGPKYHNFI